MDAEAAAYGGRASAEGTVRTGTPLAIDLQGRASNLDLRNLPPQLNAPGVASDLQLEYQLTGRGRVFSGDVRLESSTLAGLKAVDMNAIIQRLRRKPFQPGQYTYQYRGLRCCSCTFPG